jgi:predicted metalloenzyme YecM
MNHFNRHDAELFTRKLLQEAKSNSLPIRPMSIDHLCFRTDTIATYNEALRQLSQSSNKEFSGTLLTVASVNNRPIATWKLEYPIAIEDQLIECIEIPAPKPGKSYASGWEHFEALSFWDLETLGREFLHHGLDAHLSKKTLNTELAVKLPSGTVKFHYLPLSCVIACEEGKIYQAAHAAGKLFAALAAYAPLPSGGSLIGVSSASADLDVLLCVQDPLNQAEQIAAICRDVTGLITTVQLNPDAVNANISVHTPAGELEFFLQNEPTYTQRSHRHLVNEWRLLLNHGAAFREQIRTLKASGLNTEQAFCRAAKLDESDPFSQLLDAPHPTT